MFTGQLHPYQEDDVDRAVEQRNLLIAYGMGTGKTVMTIATLEDLMGSGDVRTALVIVPASLRWQWAQRIAQFTDVATQQITLKGIELTVPAECHCVVVNGTRAQRAAQYERIRRLRPDYVLLSYDTAVGDWDEVTGLDFQAIVLDEAQAIKNAGAARTRKIKKLQAPVKFALTGTPMDNGEPSEVYSIMDWIDRSVFGRWDLFDKAYVIRNEQKRPVGYKNLDVMFETLQRAMVRKTGADPQVRAHLPAVNHAVVEVSMDEQTRTLYGRIAWDLEKALEDCAESVRPVNVAALYTSAGTSFGDPALGRAAARMSVAQMVLDHPDLVRHSAELHNAATKATDPGSAYAAGLVEEGLLDSARTCPKLAALCSYVSKAMSNPAAKMAIFTRYRYMLPLLAGALAQYSPALYHGEMDAASRAGAQARFSTDPDCRVMLLTDAGGSGLDLPVASHVINYDLPNGAGAYDQRNTRHVRANSAHKTVHVVDLIVQDTIEVHKVRALEAKLATARAGVDNQHPPAGTPKRGKTSLREHLAITRGQ